MPSQPRGVKCIKILDMQVGLSSAALTTGTAACVNHIKS